MVYGRGVLHLSVLIETMRREGYEMQVGQPQVVFKEIDGKRCEPIEELTIDLPEEFGGTAVEAVTKRKGEKYTEKDVQKFSNPAETLSFYNGTTSLSSEHRSPLVDNDVLFIRLTQAVVNSTYKIILKA